MFPGLGVQHPENHTSGKGVVAMRQQGVFLFGAFLLFLDHGKGTLRLLWLSGNAGTLSIGENGWIICIRR